MTYQEWNRFINYKNIHTYLENIACELANHDITETQNILSDLRNEKLEAFRIYALTYVIPTKNCHEILDFIEKNPDTVNAVVVTNSSKATIDVICEIVPILNKIKNWCFRETYTNPKPHPESYDLALNRYYKNEQYIIGFENTNIGYESLKHSAKIIYLYVDNDDEYSKTDKWYYKKDAYIFDDYKQVVHIS
jgi:beta-phosphoglucomutase-like phosphatase (HAD superfamily)